VRQRHPEQFERFNSFDAIVITTGTDEYRRTDGTGVVPAALLGP
jgi:hypothetical protein